VAGRHIDAMDAADAAVEAARVAAVATAKVVDQNRQLAAENERLRKEKRLAPRVSNNTLGLLMSKILRTVPQHRMDQLNSVAREVEYHSVYEEVATFPQRRPWAFNVLVATLKTFAADLIVQLSSPKPESTRFVFDWRRSMLFTSFGCLYVGMAQWFFYISVFSRLCPDAMAFANKPFALKLLDKVGQEDLLIQVFVDQFVISPFVYFPVFYILKEVFLSPKDAGSPKTPVASSAKRALSNYATNFRQDNLTSLAVWFPADFVIFTAPMYMRMPLDHAVAFIWTMLMSYMRGASK
jgi:hypothetical protein